MADSWSITYSYLNQIRRHLSVIVFVLLVLLLFTYLSIPLFFVEKADNLSKSGNVNSPRHDTASPRITRNMTQLCSIEYKHAKVNGSIVYAEDLMSVEPFTYLKDFKNPCFLRDNRRISCFPYYFLVGAPKSGTTDLSRRIKRHPQVSDDIAKEPHWISRRRFQLHGIKYPTIYTYIDDVCSRAADDIAQHKIGSFYPNVFGDCSASTLWDNKRWHLLKENKDRSEPLHTNADYIHHLNPNAKIIAILRNPIDRLYSDYLYFRPNMHKSPEDFHQRANRSIIFYNNCFARCSTRHCLNIKLEKDMARVYIGLYYYSIKDYRSVFPKKNVLVVKMEDYSSNMKQYMTEIFNFLELEPLDDAKMAVVADTATIYNVNNRGVIYGPMLPKTRTMLYNFYKPHTKKLEDMLGRKFWKDTS